MVPRFPREPRGTHPRRMEKWRRTSSLSFFLSWAANTQPSFGFFVCYAVTPLLLPAHQEHIQVVRINGAVRRIPAQ